MSGRYENVKELGNGQINQDIFVLACLNQKQNGTFLEIGSEHPIIINNTYFLETKYAWRGVMVEYNTEYVDMYKFYRSNSVHVFDDARNIDYKLVLEENGFPRDMDFLQIDLHVHNDSTMATLERLDRDIMDTYTFATVCFEHDAYTGDEHDTRQRSREIFDRRGYVRLFADVENMEDWYIHPRLVTNPVILKLKTEESLSAAEVKERLLAVIGSVA